MVVCLWASGFAQQPTAAVPSPVVQDTIDATVVPAASPEQVKPDSTAEAPPTVADKKTGKGSSFRIYEIEDEKLLRALWKHAGWENLPEPGHYQILALDKPKAELVLLREGTQSGTLPPETQEWMRQQLAMSASQGDDGVTRTLGSGFWGNFWNPSDWLAPYQWKTGLEVSAGMDLSTFRHTTPLVGQQYDLTFVQRPSKWLTTEVGAHVNRYGGGPRRNLYDPHDDTPGWDAWGEYTPWWHAAIGVPGVKWEVALANRDFPEYYWLDPNAGDGSYKLGVVRAGYPADTGQYADGTVMAAWNARGHNPKPSNNNLAHTLQLKAGNLRYQAHFDNDVYVSAIHQLMIEEIRAPFGQLAIGFVASHGASHSRIRLDMLPWTGGFGAASGDTRIHAYLLRVNLDYRDASTFHVGVSTTIQLDAPYLRPGESK